MTAADYRAVIADFTPAVKAWERAKRKGYVWIDGQTQLFQTIESTGAFCPNPGPNPDQLTLDEI